MSRRLGPDGRGGAGESPAPPPTLFDRPAARAATDEAVERVGEHADPDWKVVALYAVRRVAKRQEFLTTDHVWEALAETGSQTHERRALGAIMRQAATAGLIAPTSHYQPTDRPEAHRNPKRVWRSCIVEDGW